MKYLLLCFALLNIAPVMAATLSAKPELKFEKEEFGDGTAVFSNVRVIIAGQTFYLGAVSTTDNLDLNPSSFCKSQGYRKSIQALEEIDYSSKKLAFAVFEKIDDSIRLFRNLYYPFSKIVCANEIKPKLVFDR